MPLSYLKLKKFKLVPVDDEESVPNLQSEINGSQLPEGLKKNALAIARRIETEIQLDQDGNVIYPDGTRGSNFSSLIQSVTEPVGGETKRDWDFLKFVNLLMQNGIPDSLFGDNVLCMVAQLEWNETSKWKAIF